MARSHFPDRFFFGSPIVLFGIKKRRRAKFVWERRDLRVILAVALLFFQDCAESDRLVARTDD